MNEVYIVTCLIKYKSFAAQISEMMYAAARQYKPARQLLNASNNLAG